MDKPKRTDDANEQIRTARQMPGSWEAGTGADKSPDSEQCKDAERPAESHPGAPSKLPGYGR